MKEFIYNNYNLLIEKLYGDYFFVKDDKVKIIKLKDIKNINEIEKKIEISNNLYKMKNYVNTFIINKENKYITKKNNGYILLEKINDRDNCINLNYLEKFNGIQNNLEKRDIVYEWETEIDKFEEKIITYDKEYKMMLKSSNYYIGLAENAIKLYKETKKTNDENISHAVGVYDFSKENLNDPINFIKSDRIYNITQYLKKLIIENTLSLEMLEYILDKINENEIELFFSYMLYPNYYFELVNDKIEEKKIKNIIKIIPIYEKILAYIKEKFKKNKKIQLFIWLK